MASTPRSSTGIERCTEDDTGGGVALRCPVELIADNWRWLATGLGQGETASRWLDRLPGEMVIEDARLCLARGWIALGFGRQQEVTDWLRAAEACPPPASPEILGPPETALAALNSAIARLQAVQALVAGDVQASIEAGRRSLELEPWRSRPPHRGVR